MARYLIRQAHGGETRTIRDGGLPYFLNLGWVVLDTLDDESDSPPLYLSKAEGDLRWAKISDLSNPESTEIALISEALTDSPGLRAISVAAIEDADEVAPTGAWDFAQAPTVAGVALGTGSVPDAAPTTKGIVQLAGDLGGTATAPTVPGLAGKASTAHTHGVTDLTATGTRSASTFLRGDNTWAAPAGGSSADLGTVLTSAMTTTEIQALFTAAPADSAFYIPAGTVIQPTAQLTFPVVRGLIHGRGELRYTNTTHLSGTGKPSGLKITGAGARVQGIRLTNPNEVVGASNTQGTDSYNQGISIAASGVSVLDCIVEKFQQGIAVEPTGEWLDHNISRNRVIDVLGRGDGAASASVNGEDGGDGIVTWGARATIVGNIVNAKAGRDCRIGIHAEQLATFEVTPGAYSSSMVTIASNVVTGPFRRGITVEEMNNTTIVGNTVADSTWWALAVVNGEGNVVSGNTVRYTRATTDNHGSAWAPKRAPLHVRGASIGTVMTNNSVVVSGAADCFLHTTQEGVTRPVRPLIEGNSFSVTGAGTVTEGLLLEYTDAPSVIANLIAGFSSKGIASWDLTEYFVSGNRVRGNGSPTIGVDLPSTAGVISDNEIRGLSSGGTGINAVNHTTGGSLINGNNIIGPMAVGIELFGTSATTSVVGNRLGGTFSTIKIANAGVNVTLSGNTP